MQTFLLVPSPLLGPATWEPTARWLREQGHVAVVAEPGASWATPDDVLEAIAGSAEGLEAVVLVPHSNAGLFVPRFGELIDIRSTVFVDAALAGLEPETPLAPTGMIDRLRELAGDDGLLPPWTQWWAEEDLVGLFPDDTARTAVEAEQRRLPLSYFTADLPVPAGWERRPSGYLAFGETYAVERARAAGFGWPVRTLVGQHLHQLHEPAAVGRAILDLVAASRPCAGGVSRHGGRV